MNDKSLTGSYAALQASFWMDICVALSFASVYLKGTGYTNSGLGAIIAAGSLLSVFAGTALSSLIDRYSSVTASGLMTPVILIRAVAIIALISSPHMGLLTTISFAAYIGSCLSVNSLILKLYVDAESSGLNIDYGIARGCGSMAYVVISFLLGPLVEATSYRTVVWAAAVVCIFQYAVFLLFSDQTHKHSETEKAEYTFADSVETARGTGLLQFAAGNRRFCILLVGTLLIFFSHSTLCSFLIQVTENIGGGTGEMGFLNGFMAAVEIPVMLSFSRLLGNKSTASILRTAFVFFALKAAAVAAAGSLPMMTAAFLLQAPSYGLHASAIVPYIDEHISHEDSAKAQSLAFSMTTFASVLAGIISGRLLDITSVTITLWIAAAVCLAGTVTAIAGLDSKKIRRV